MERKLPNDIFFAEIERLISEGREVRLKVRGTSMRPFLQEGDFIILSPLADTGPMPGAIVLFRHDGKHILHRLVERNGENLTLQGDSVPTTESVSVADVVAVVKEVVKENGEIMRYGSRSWNRKYNSLLRRKKTRSLLSKIKRRILPRR